MTQPTQLTDPNKTTTQIGYDPDYDWRDAGFGPLTPEEWAFDFAVTMSNKWANGGLGDTGAGSLWDASRWGGALPDAGTRGSGIIDESVGFNVFLEQGRHLATSYSNEQLAALGLPPVPQANAEGQYSQAPLSDLDKQIVAGADVTASEAERNRAQGSAALINASANMLSAQNEMGIASLRASTDMSIAKLRAAVDREAIAVQRYGIQEGGRQFDLGLAEDRRQFNEDLSFRRDVLAQQKTEFRTGVVIDLLDRAVELSRAPVDWVAHQYFMANMGAPLTQAGLISSAAVFGAVPPSGPSAAGPVVGGPAAMDGDTALASSLGVEAGFVPVSEAARVLPGTGFGGTSPESTAPATVQNIAATQTGGDVAALDMAVEQARATEVAPHIQQNPVMDAAVSTLQGQPGVIPETMQPQPDQSPPAIAAMQEQPATPVASATSTGPDGQDNTGMFVGEAAQAQPQVSTGAFGQPVVTGAGSGAQNPQGEEMLRLISVETGIPIEQLRQVINPSLLAGGYTKEQIEASPVVQSLRTGAMLPEVRTAPVGVGGVEIQAFGVPLGIRSGQDINAQSILKGGEVNRGLIAGAIQGAGLNANDAFRQSILASPVTNYTPGSFGKRVFG